MAIGLRARIILIVAIPAVVAGGVHGLVRMRQERQALFDQDLSNMALTARAIQVAVENTMRNRPQDLTRLLSEMVEQQDLIDRIRLFDAELRPEIVSNPLVASDPAPTEALRRAMQSGAPQTFYRTHDGQSYLYYVVPLQPTPGRIAGAMEIVHLAADVDRRIRAAVIDVWLRLSVLMIVIVSVTALALQRQVLRPVARLMEGIRTLGAGGSEPRVPVDRRDELGRVAEAFNEMAARLEAAHARLLAETERAVELEQHLRQAQTLAVAGKLASGLAHEVGTPLNVVSGRAEFLLKTVPVGAEGRSDLETIVRQIERITGIIDSLLDTVRPQVPKVEAVNLGDVLDHLLPLLHHTARRGGVTLSSHVPAELPPLLADPGQLQQVVINLVLNALDATPAGGDVTLTASPREHDGRAGVALRVADTGSGVDPANIKRIFEPFFTTKPRGVGTGLGLAICRDIVTNHGGDINVESTLGAGSTFTVWMPASNGARG